MFWSVFKRSLEDIVFFWLRNVLCRFINLLLKFFRFDFWIYFYDEKYYVTNVGIGLFFFVFGMFYVVCFGDSFVVCVER